MFIVHSRRALGLGETLAREPRRSCDGRLAQVAARPSWERLRLRPPGAAPGRSGAAGAPPGAAAAAVAVRRLQRDRRRAAKSLEVRDHAEDLLIGEADRRLVDRGHRRRESRHDEGVGFVHRLGEVLDIAQARDAALRAGADPLEVGEPERPGLADRVAGRGRVPCPP